jgi:carbonic anhydrase
MAGNITNVKGKEGLSPEQVVKKLKERGKQFTLSKELPSSNEIEEAIKRNSKSQHPIAVVVTCSDSRVIPEYIFRAKPGEIFTVRSAGNVPDKNMLASIEYAVKHLGVDVIIVLGHTRCGAVKAALDIKSNVVDKNEEEKAESFLPLLIEKIANNIEESKDLDEAVVRNAERVVKELERMFREVKVIPAIYDIEKAEVKWLDEVGKHGRNRK